MIKIKDFFMGCILVLIPILFIMAALCSPSEIDLKANVIKIVTKK